jgi:hypothetical protein
MAKARLSGRVAIGFLALLLLWISGAWANPTTSDQARTVVANWLYLAPHPLGQPLAQQVKDVRTFADASGPLYYVVYLEPAGLVFVPADDLMEPIIGFAPEAKEIDPSPENPLWVLVNRDIPARVLYVRQMQGQARVTGTKFAAPAPMQKAQSKWTALAQGQSLQPAGPDGMTTNPEYVCVTPLVQSKWSQDLVDDNTPGSPHCYDYYTNWGGIYYPCGCVATAMAQVMRKHQYPTAGVNPVSFPITYSGISISEPLLGGTLPGGAYNWGLMELDPKKNGVSLSQCQAIGALTHDAGAAVNMDYAVGGSGAFSVDATKALTNVFMFANAKLAINSPYSIPGTQLFNMVNSSLDAGFPVIFGIMGAVGGHEIVGDGYGNHWGTWYHHLNMGWANNQDAWYNLPYADTSPGPFNIFDECIYNIFPSGTGEIISGRVTNSCGLPVPAGVTVTASGPGNPPAATTSNSGIYAFPKLQPNSTYTIHVNGTGYTDQTVTTGQSVDGHITCGNVWGVNFVANRPPVTNPEYVLFNLGGLDLKVSQAFGINNQGVIVGGMRTDNIRGECNPCIWLEVAKNQFGFIRWGTDVVNWGYFQGINDNNLAVGWVDRTITVNGSPTDTYWPINAQPTTPGGTFYQLYYMNIPTTGLGGTVPFGRAYGVNKNGEIVGQAVITPAGQTQGQVCSAYWANATAQPITQTGLAGGGTDGNRASHINDFGYIVGTCGQAYLWNGGNVTWLGPSGQSSEARSLMNASAYQPIVGLLGQWDRLLESANKAVTFSGGSATPLDPNKGQAAHGINSKGQIVGSGPAFVYDSVHGLRDLNTLVNEPDWNLRAAYAINDNGDIVGDGSYGAGHCYGVQMAFLLRPLFTITASAGTGGNISPTGAVKVIRGDDQSFAITPDNGFQISSVLVDGSSKGAISSYTFPNVTDNHTISVTFTGSATHTIHARAGSGGYIVPNGDMQVPHGNSQTFNITPLAGFNIAAVRVDGVSQGAISSYTFPSVTTDHTITASFVIKTFTINASAGSGGTISPTGAVKVNFGADKTFTITPNSGFQVADVVVDNVSQGAITSYTFNSVTADHIIVASFTPSGVTYTITATAGSNGSISPAGAVQVNSGATQVFTIMANSGYHIVDVKVDNVSQGPLTSYTFSNVKANHTITASFAAGTAYITTASAGAGGTVSPAGGVQVIAGANQTFTITPNRGYHIVDVKVDNVSQGPITSYTFRNVTANHTITASFAANRKGLTAILELLLLD